MEEIMKCDYCDWEGIEEDLIINEYDLYNLSMPVAGCCPNCKHEI